MAKASSSLFILIILVGLIMLSQSTTAVWHTLEKDPPSIFNYGPGGITYFYVNALTRIGDVNVIYDLSELNKYDPRKYVLLLLSPDVSLNDKEVRALLSWVEIGGEAIVGDEVNTTFLLISKLGFQQTHRFPTILPSQCYLSNGSTIKILLNVFTVYTPVNATMISKPICINEFGSIAYEVTYGQGQVYIIGDSSLVINELFAKIPSSFANNTVFIHNLIGSKNLIIYEGSRIYKYAELKILSTVLVIIFNFISSVFSNIMSLGLMHRLIFLLVLMILSTVSIIAKFGMPGSLRKIFKLKQNGIDEEKAFELAKLINNISHGVKTWIESTKTR